jgi:hypothetical protein
MRISIILLTCLLIFSHLRAQTDSTPPPPAAAPAQVQDTTVRAVTHPIRTLSRRDSIRRDSIRRVRRDSISRVRRDSVARLHPDTAGRDTGATPETGATPVVTGRTDTMVRKESTVSRAAGGDPASGAAPANTGPLMPEEPHHPNSKDSLFYLIVAILFYFAMIRIFFEKYFNNLLTLFFRVSLRQQQIREQVLQTPLPSLLLNVLFVISAGLYACFLLHYSRWGAGVRFWVLYLNCMALLAAIYLVKFVVLKFIGWVFSISRATDIYIFIVFLVNKMLGIFLLPFLIVIIFSGQEWREVFITISLAMVFVLWTYRVLASYRPVRNEIKLTPFYFFLYLCAFEIAPLLLIYKVLLTYLEKVY